ncbi:MAG: pilus assembly protein PilV [Burkholderiales bacterium]|nr:pilus assembly protein PilV [Burkholderiales bacterium]
MTPTRTPQRCRMAGLSLVEALVALAVMGFGTLAVIGVQASLRLNGDIARQRSEAVRVAQQELQATRRFVDLAGYRAVATLPARVESLGNSLYTVTRTVVDASAADAPPRRKTLVVDVDWLDRTGQSQAVQMRTALHGVQPIIGASLALPADADYLRSPRSRHPAIPPTAVAWGEDAGFSRFDPPRAGGIGWVFDNLSGVIVRRCADATAASCVAFDARLLSGYVRFALVPGRAPNDADTEFPPSPRPVDAVLAVRVRQTAPVVRLEPCYSEDGDSSVAYYCAVEVGAAGKWSGRSEVVGLPLAPTIADVDAGDYRVCRYTPYAEHREVGSGSPPMRNEDHPLDYVEVAAALPFQNFLVVRAGDGSVAYACPGDGPSPHANTNTWHHQPAT